MAKKDAVIKVKAKIKKKFSNRQIVVFKFGDRNLVGRVCNIKPVGKKAFIYDVKGENGITYEDLTVDAEMKHSIDTHMTKLFYIKNGISEEIMPGYEMNEAELDVDPGLMPLVEAVDERDSRSEEILYEREDSDPNY